MEKEIMNDEKQNRKRIVLIVIGFIVLISLTFGITYAFFNYTRTGTPNVLSTGIIQFNYQEGTTLQLTNQFPISESDLTNNHKLTFSISGHNNLDDGVTFNVYAVRGDDVTGKTWLTDNIIKMKFEAPTDGDGFSITTNNFATAASPTFTNDKALIATGLIKNTQALTTKTYSLYMWVDENLAFISSTTKRANNAEGNPSLADATSGTTTATRYMKNDDEASTVTLYPANADSTGKIIYTTKEFSNAHYTIKIRIEANEA